jgi:DNA invertase Pin-like site-specific DNA recombinase
MVVGYARVSALDQNIDRQIKLFEEIKVDKVFQEKISGKDTDRPELKEMLKFLREGDTLIVESFSRLARNTRDLLNIVEELKQNKVKFISKKESIDTSTPAGKFMLTVFAGISELERDFLLERQREGIRIAQKKGKYKGRSPIPDEKWNPLWAEVQQGFMTRKGMYTKLGITKSHFFKLVKQRREKAEVQNNGTQV